MALIDRWGPPAPERLVTVQSARLRNLMLQIHCLPCRRVTQMRGERLPDPGRSLAVGELWLAGRFRCAQCFKAAGRLEVLVMDQTAISLETWRLGDPLVAERLRRHWRWDRYDRRDWRAWYGQGGGTGAPAPGSPAKRPEMTP